MLDGCSTVEVEKVKVQQASSYKYSCNKSGLIVSVDPYIEEERVNKAFGNLELVAQECEEADPEKVIQELTTK